MTMTDILNKEVIAKFRLVIFSIIYETNETISQEILIYKNRYY